VQLCKQVGGHARRAPPTYCVALISRRACTGPDSGVCMAVVCARRARPSCGSRAAAAARSRASAPRPRRWRLLAATLRPCRACRQRPQRPCWRVGARVLGCPGRGLLWLAGGSVGPWCSSVCRRQAARARRHSRPRVAARRVSTAAQASRSQTRSWQGRTRS
jgi:hypothetical protein